MAGKRESFCKGSWGPKDPCPVDGCMRKQIGSRLHFFRHWKEKHEKVIFKYQCPKCESSHKRKSGVSRHSRIVHGAVVDFSELQGEYYRNKEFLDPSPLTLEQVLKPI